MDNVSVASDAPREKLTPGQQWHEMMKGLQETDCYARLRHLSLFAVLLAVVSVIAMVIDWELEYGNGSPMKMRAVHIVLRCIMSVSSLLLVYMITAYYLTCLNLAKLRNLQPPSANLLSGPEGAMFLIECFLAVVHVPPGLESLQGIVPSSVLTGVRLFMVPRLYLILRAIKDHSFLSGTAARFVGILSEIEFTNSFVSKVIVKHRPYVVTAIMFAILFLAASYFVHVSEREVNEEHRRFVDSAWHMVATVTTVGYGDLSVKTHLGRLASACGAAVGIFLSGFVVAVLHRELTLTDHENSVLAFLERDVNRSLRQEAAALAIQHGWRLYKVKCLRLSHGAIKRAERKMYATLRRWREVKKINASARHNEGIRPLLEHTYLELLELRTMMEDQLVNDSLAPLPIGSTFGHGRGLAAGLTGEGCSGYKAPSSRDSVASDSGKFNFVRPMSPSTTQGAQSTSHQAVSKPPSTPTPNTNKPPLAAKDGSKTSLFDFVASQQNDGKRRVQSAQYTLNRHAPLSGRETSPGNLNTRNLSVTSQDSSTSRTKPATANNGTTGRLAVQAPTLTGWRSRGRLADAPRGIDFIATTAVRTSLANRSSLTHANASSMISNASRLSRNSDGAETRGQSMQTFVQQMQQFNERLDRMESTQQAAAVRNQATVAQLSARIDLLISNLSGLLNRQSSSRQLRHTYSSNLSKDELDGSLSMSRPETPETTRRMDKAMRDMVGRVAGGATFDADASIGGCSGVASEESASGVVAPIELHIPAKLPPLDVEREKRKP